MSWTWIHNIGYFLLGVLIVAGFCGFMYFAFYDIGLDVCKLVGWEQHGTGVFDYAVVTLLGIFSMLIGSFLVWLIWFIGRYAVALWQG